MVNRKALPQNYALNDGNLVEDFEDGWALRESGGTAQYDEENFKTGSKSLKLTSGAGTRVAVEKTISLTFHDRKDCFGMWIYVHDPEPITDTFSYIMVYISSVINYVKTKNAQLTLVEIIYPGWNFVKIPIPSWYTDSNESWDNEFVRMLIYLYPQDEKTTSVSFDSLYSNIQSTPKILPSFDDSYNSQYAAFQYMENKRLKGTLFLNNNLDTINTLTTEQVGEIYDAGWSICPHTNLHQDLTTLTTEQIVTAIENNQQYLLDKGFTRGNDHFAYPFGTWNQTVIDTLESIGIKTARTVQVGTMDSPYIVDMYRLFACTCGATGNNLTQTKSWLDKIILRESTMFSLHHEFVSNNPTGTAWLINDFKSWIDYIAARKIECVTINEWYDGLTNPRYKI